MVFHDKLEISNIRGFNILGKGLLDVEGCVYREMKGVEASQNLAKDCSGFSGDHWSRWAYKN